MFICVLVITLNNNFMGMTFDHPELFVVPIQGSLTKVVSVMYA